MSAKSSTKALVETIRAALPPGHEWDERDLALLSLAEAQAADIDRLEANPATARKLNLPHRAGRVNLAREIVKTTARS